MFAGTVEDLKHFMSELLIGTAFDAWEVVEAKAETYYELSVSGRVKKSFFAEDAEAMSDFITWKETKEIFYRMIRGKRLPGLLRIVLCCVPAEAERLRRECRAGEEEEGSRLLLNIRYAEGRCVVTGGISRKSFTTDKTLEQAWEQELRRFFREKKIAVLEV